MDFGLISNQNTKKTINITFYHTQNDATDHIYPMGLPKPNFLWIACFVLCTHATDAVHGKLSARHTHAHKAVLSLGGDLKSMRFCVQAIEGWFDPGWIN